MKVENIAAVVVTAELASVHADRRAHRRDGVVDRRRAQPAGRDAAADTAARARTARWSRWRRGRSRSAGSAPAAAATRVAVNHLTVGRVPARRARCRRRVRPSLAGARHADASRCYEPDFASASARGGGDQHRARRRRARTSLDRRHRCACRCRPPIRAHLCRADRARSSRCRSNIDAVARVVINERTGTVVMGGDVRIGRRGGRARQPVGADLDPATTSSQPAPLSAGGRPRSCRRPQVDVDEGDNKLIALDAGHDARPTWCRR
mgnify:CR=1 FL=1